MTDLNFICKCLGGSHMYGLDTPSSDMDQRGIFINSNIGTILGLDRHEHLDIKTETEDAFYSELRHFLNSCRKSNSQALELLFNERWEYKTSEWDYIQQNKFKLINSQGVFKCLMGYINGELKLALGQRKGQIGGKRYADVERLGYSKKNFVQLFRLAWAGAFFFKEGYFPINVKEHDLLLWEELMEIKTESKKFAKEELERRAHRSEEYLKKCFDNRNQKVDYSFDVKFANEICLGLYLPILKNYEI